MDSEGRKFGKSVGGAIWLSADKLSPYKFYQYLFAVTDADVIKLLRMLTFLELVEIDAIAEEMKQVGGCLGIGRLVGWGLWAILLLP